jgi:phage terminase large subunit
MAKIINPNLRFLCNHLRAEERNELIKAYDQAHPGDKDRAFAEYKRQCSERGIKSGVVLEGSSRSAKTWSSLDFILYITSKVETNVTINIIKETYVSFKTTLYDDFNRRLPMYGIDSPFANRQEVKSFKLFGSKINLIGADSESAQLGVSCDYLYFNEALDISKGVRNQAEMRCRKFWWMDYNPKFANHDIYESTVTRPDVAWLKTTYKDNYFISPAERIKIESYQSVSMSAIAIHFGSNSEEEAIKYSAIKKAVNYDTKANLGLFPVEHLAELERCKRNEEAGTASLYDWKVYGLGERMAQEGLIFPNVTWIKEFPKDIESIYWGTDFGYTVDPSTLVKVGIKGSDMFVHCMAYQPTPTPNDYINMVKPIIKDGTAWADPSGESGGRLYISSARRAGLNIFAANVYPGSIKDGLAIIKKYKLHLVDTPEMRKEQAGYCMAMAKVNGVMVRTDNPIDANNHIFDPVRYTCLSNRL